MSYKLLRLSPGSMLSKHLLINRCLIIPTTERNVINLLLFSYISISPEKQNQHPTYGTNIIHCENIWESLNLLTINSFYPSVVENSVNS